MKLLHKLYDKATRFGTYLHVHAVRQRCRFECAPLSKFVLITALCWCLQWFPGMPTLRMANSVSLKCIYIVSLKCMYLMTNLKWLSHPQQFIATSKCKNHLNCLIGSLLFSGCIKILVYYAMRSSKFVCVVCYFESIHRALHKRRITVEFFLVL